MTGFQEFMNFNRCNILSLWGTLLMCGAVWLALPREAVSAGPQVRVALTREAKQLEISVRGRYRIRQRTTKEVLKEGKRLKKASLNVFGRDLVLDGQTLNTDGISIYSRKDISIGTGEDAKRYRGDIDISIQEDGTLLVVNRIDLENYIRGVLYHETSNRWPMQALKAQAVAARTYAVYQIEESRGAAYDVTSDIYAQVYGGKSAERFRTNLAVQRTRGQVLTYDGKILPAYYHASCAGTTEDVSEMWDHKSIPPLSGVVCPFCRRSPHFHWKRNFRLADIQDALNKKGYAIGLIKEIRVKERDRSGRNRTMEIVGRKGETLTIPGKDLRNIVGPNQIKSNRYGVVMKGYYCDLIGQGWGHGVGMCQWGAREMDRQGYSYRKILEFYYPGAAIDRVDRVFSHSDKP